MTIFTSIFHAIENFGLYVLGALVGAVNLVIAGIGAFAGVMLGLLPSMPTAPTAPAADWVGWLNWLVPVAPMVAAFVVWVGIWALYLLVRIPLRWVRAL